MVGSRCGGRPQERSFYVVDEREWVGVAVVGGMLLACRFVPTFVFGEECVCSVGRVVNLCEAQAVGQSDGLPVHFRPAYYVDVFLRCAMLQCLFERTERVAAREVALRAAQHDVPAVGQGALRQRLERVASHYYGVARGQRLKAFHVVGQSVYQFVVLAYGEVARHCGYYRYLHVCQSVVFVNGLYVQSYANLARNVRPRVVVLEFEVLVIEAENVLHIGVKLHYRQLSRLS